MEPREQEAAAAWELKIAVALEQETAAAQALMTIAALEGGLL